MDVIRESYFNLRIQSVKRRNFSLILLCYVHDMCLHAN